MRRVQPPTALRLPCKACCWIPTPIPMALVAGRCRVWLSEFGRPPRVGAPSGSLRFESSLPRCRGDHVFSLVAL